MLGEPKQSIIAAKRLSLVTLRLSLLPYQALALCPMRFAPYIPVFKG